jgi:hypothetical protein
MSQGNPAPTRMRLTLGELCEVLPGRNRPAPPDAEGSGLVPLVRAEEIGSELTLHEELSSATELKPKSVLLQSGDIIGSISAPYGRWVIVPDSYGTAAAGDHTVVLRKRLDFSIWLLLGFLRSKTGKQYLKSTTRGSVIQRLGWRQLAQVPVPLLNLPTHYIDRVLRQYDGHLRKLEQEISELRDRSSSIYEDSPESESATRLDALQGISASLEQLEGLSDATRIARNSYPYPIARALRAIARTTSPRARYHEVVHEMVETLSATLMAICASIAREHHLPAGPSLRAWAAATRRKGATIGKQHGAIYEVARASLHSWWGVDTGGLDRALGDSYAPATQLMRDLLDERNRIHGDYPRSDIEFNSRLRSAEHTLHSLLTALSFLARWELRHTRSVEPIEDIAGNLKFSASFNVLRGDNPDWDVAIQTSEKPVFRGRTYAQIDGKLLLDLYPYLLLLDCNDCGATEVYQPNSFSSSHATLKSIDRGHSQPSDDERLLRDLAAAYDIFD